jgi:hypothetical protein
LTQKEFVFSLKKISSFHAYIRGKTQAREKFEKGLNQQPAYVEVRIFNKISTLSRSHRMPCIDLAYAKPLGTLLKRGIRAPVA